MRSTYMWSLMLALSPFGTAAAQRADTGSVRRDSLRHRIEERFSARAQQELGLTDDQASKLRATSLQFGTRRSELHSRGRQLRQALSAQLQPGIAANQDSVARLTDAMIQLKAAEAQISRDEVKEQARYLNPVQRARLYVMRERFVHRIKEVHGRRGKMDGKRRGGHWDDVREHRQGGDRSRERPMAE